MEHRGRVAQERAKQEDETGKRVGETGRWTNDGLALLEWEAFAGFIAPVAEGVGTAINARVEALRQQHDADVQAYKARSDYLKSMLAFLGIHEPLELLPTTSGASTLQSLQNYQYTTDIFTKN